jgi:hypothetical protein
VTGIESEEVQSALSILFLQLLVGIREEDDHSMLDLGQDSRKDHNRNWEQEGKKAVMEDIHRAYIVDIRTVVPKRVSISCQRMVQINFPVPSLYGDDVGLALLRRPSSPFPFLPPRPRENDENSTTM